MPACPVHTQPSNSHLNISLNWNLIINVERVEVSWYGPVRGEWLLQLVQGHIVSQHLLQLCTEGVCLPPWYALVPPIQYLVCPLYIWWCNFCSIQTFPNLLWHDLLYMKCIHLQGLSRCLCQVPCHIPVVVFFAEVVPSCVNQPKWHSWHLLWTWCVVKWWCRFFHLLLCLKHHIL